MYLVGLTGGIASGKSTVSRILQDLNCPVVDADKIAREVVKPGKPAWKLIVRHFGYGILQEDGNLDRPKLGQIIFNDDKKRKLLNSCTHPYIQRVMVWRICFYFLKGCRFIILDVPLLLEGSTLRKLVSKVVVVYCDEETHLRRLMARNSFTEEEAQSRIHSQLPLKEKCVMADHVIDNTGTIEETRKSVEALHHQLDSSKLHWRTRFGLLGIGLLLLFAIICVFQWVI